MAVIYDNSGNVRTASSVTTLSIADFVVANQQNRVLLVFVSTSSAHDADDTPAMGITYDDVLMTLLDYNNTVAGYASLFGLVAPSVGTADIVATWETSAVCSLVALSAYGAKQTDQFGTIQKNTGGLDTNSCGVTIASASDDLTVSFAASGLNNAELVTTQTRRSYTTGVIRAHVDTGTGASGNITHTWSHAEGYEATNSRKTVIGVNIVQASTASALPKIFNNYFRRRSL